MQWAKGGFAGMRMGAATFTGVETGIIAGYTWFTGFALTGLSYEGGIFLGSMLSEIPGPDQQPLFPEWPAPDWLIEVMR